MLQLPLNIYLDSAATLESFIIGSNAELLVRLKSFSGNGYSPKDNNNCSQKANNMIFVWGAQGSGKSHLAQAICHRFDKSNDKICVYLPLNNEHISHHILEGLAEVDLVCIDSLECVQGNADWQVGLFNLYNEMKDLGKKLVIFSQETPKQMRLDLADLTSRLSSMSVYKLQKIEEYKLIEFIQKSSINVGMEMSDDVANFILNRSDRSVINLKNIINILDEQSLAHQRKVTIPFVKEILNI